MYLKTISTLSFRNLGKVDEIELPRRGILVAVAPNAAGKTNFLESVAVLLRGKSFRAQVSECVLWGEDAFLLHGLVKPDNGDDVRVAVRYHLSSRKMRIEEAGEPASVVSFYAHYPFVIFLPEDTFLFSRGPAGRRNFLNQALVTHQGYLSALVQYHRVLRQRNAILKKKAGYDVIRSWTELLVGHAEVLWRHRDNFINFIDTHVQDLYSELSGEDRQFSVRLLLGAGTVDTYLKELEEAFEVEQKHGYTLRGPHRDDFLITTDERPVAAVLSRGQVRSLVLTLKVLTHRYIKQLTHEEPLLLLDDVFSELDEQRQTALLKNLPQTQILLTCTTVPETLRSRDDVYLLDLRSIINDTPTKTISHAPAGRLDRQVDMSDEGDTILITASPSSTARAVSSSV